MNEQSQSTTLQSAIATPDQKLSPDEVPIMDFVGLAKMPATEGYTLLIFKNDDEGTVGVRVDDESIQALRTNTEGM